MRPKPSASASACFCGKTSRALLAFALIAHCTSQTAHCASPNEQSEIRKIAVVDADKLLEQLIPWQETQARLRTKQAKTEAVLTEHKKEIDRIQAELDYFKPGSRDHDQRKADLAARQQKLAALAAQLQNTLAAEANAALDATRKEIEKAIRDYAAANAFALVLSARTTLYAAPACDITLDVAREMNRRYKENLETKDRQRPPENK